MKVMRCNRCNKTQQTGKFCLDCGQNLVEVITSNVEFKPIKTNRDSEKIKKDIRSWLNRIGVQNQDIQIYTGDGASVEYNLGKNRYNFKSVLQNNITNNLAAVEQFLHYRILGIERGIETTEQAFAGYEALPDPAERLKQMTDSELRQEIKRCHPDTGNSDKETWNRLMEEKG